MLKMWKLRDYFQKNFLAIVRNMGIWDSFWRKIWISLTKILGFWDFFEIPPTLRSHNFFSTEPISIIFGLLESSISETFISGVLVHIWQEYVTLLHPLTLPAVSKLYLNNYTIYKEWQLCTEIFEIFRIAILLGVIGYHILVRYELKPQK